MISKVYCYALAALIGGAAILGCGKSVDADTLLSSEGALSLKEIKALKETVSSVSIAVPIIKSCNKAAREAFAAGNPEKAHRPLDILDALFIHLPRVIQSDRLSESQKKKAESLSSQLFVLFSSFHSSYDSGEDPKYEDIADQAQSLIDELESVLPKTDLTSSNND